MFERVLVAMDLSPATEALVSSLPGLRQFGTEEIILAHVARPIKEPVSGSLREIGDLRERLNGLAKRLEGEGFNVSVEVPTGSPATELIKVAQTRDPDVIVVGSRSHTRIREAFVGSVAWELVRRASRPVLLQRIEANRPDPEAALEVRNDGLPRRVIHPTDFSAAAQRALPWLQALAARGVKSFTLLHVLPVEDTEGRSQAEEQLKALAEQLDPNGDLDVKAQVRLGTPHEEILSEGGKDTSNMVVMGTHGRGVLPEIVMGSESRQVVRRAAATVLLIPTDAAAPLEATPTD
jgi:nucleotide-binding universal stress UspA family protein